MHRATGIHFTLLILAVLSVPACTTTDTQPSVHYTVSFPDIVHHEARITVRFENVPNEDLLELRMSRTSPGRYAYHDFARNVYDIQAVDGRGEALPLTQPNPHQWNAQPNDGTVTVTYTLFGDQADGTYPGIDRTHAHLNMPATLMFARGLEEAPITVEFNPPDPSWTIATQLIPTGNSNEFSAPDLQYLMDSPTEIGPLDWYTWTVDGRSMRIAVHHNGEDAAAEEWVESVKRIVDAEKAVYGELPEYDGGTYTFIVDYLPYVVGDGMEHRNSTFVTGTSTIEPGGRSNLGTMAHEFFHQWNVERIRPETLEPFDFEEANPSGALWFAEGFTSYYTGLSILRADRMDVGEYAAGLGNTINAVVNAPGRKHRSAVDMSRFATFFDRASSADRMNLQNTFISYYTWGSAIGLGLDLTLRTQYDTSLDDFMRLVWQRFGKTGHPYTLDDLEETLASLTSDPAFAERFFDSYIRGQEVVDYTALLAHAGLLLRPSESDKTFAGGAFGDGEDGVRVTVAPDEGTPLYQAGIDVGDVILAVDGAAVTQADAFEALLDHAKPGEALSLRVRSRMREVEVDLLPGSSPRLEVVTFEEVGRELTEEARAFREAWFTAPQR